MYKACNFLCKIKYYGIYLSIYLLAITELMVNPACKKAQDLYIHETTEKCIRGF